MYIYTYVKYLKYNPINFCRHFSRKYPIQLTIKNHNTPIDLSSTSVLKTSEENNEILERKDSSSFEFEPSSDVNTCDLDIGTTIMNSDVNIFQKLQDETASSDVIPCGDETRILLFARNDREKEDWYRRFKAASQGCVNDQENIINGFVTITDEDILSTFQQNMMCRTATDHDEKNTENSDDISKSLKPSKLDDALVTNENKTDKRSNSCFEGLLITTARGPTDYLRFMSKFQVSFQQFESFIFLFVKP